MKPTDYELKEQGIIRTRMMKFRCDRCKRDLHWGEYVLIMSDEENSMLRILCRDIFCICNAHHIAIPVLFPTLERAKQERVFCDGRKREQIESLDWYKFWQMAPLLWE